MKYGSQLDGAPGRWRIASLCALSLVLLLAAGNGRAQSQCSPADEYSRNIDAMLDHVQGPGFPSSENLESWHRRRGEIQKTFAEIVALSDGDEDRRNAAIEALVAAESIAMDTEEALRLIERTRGEVRAWARRRISSYYSMGITPEDRKRVGGETIGDLKQSWRNTKVLHPLRSLPVYEKRAAVLRGLAKYDPPGCK